MHPCYGLGGLAQREDHSVCAVGCACTLPRFTGGGSVPALSDQEALAVAAAYADATRKGDVDAIVELSDPDVAIWHNFDDAEVDLTQLVKTLRWLHRCAPDVAWDDVAVLRTATGFVWQAVMHGTGRGGPFRAPTCIVVTLSAAGKVTRLAEYLDPAALAAVSG